MHYLKNAAQRLDKRNRQQGIRDENLKRLFNLLNKHRELSRSDLARITGLSPTTVSNLVEELMRERLAVEVGYAQTSQTGRKPINLRIDSSGRQIPVFVLGRMEVRYTLYDLQMDVLETMEVAMDPGEFGCAEEDMTRFPDVGEEYAALMEDILRKSKYFRREDALALCIAYPGIYLQKAGYYALCPQRVRLGDDTLAALQERTGLPIFLGTVGQDMAYAQHKMLDSRGERAEELMFIVVRDGIGTGIVENGRVRGSESHFFGEVGHVSINYRGKACSCGGRGCLCQYVNRGNVIERVRQALDFHADGQLSAKQMELSLEEIGKAVDRGHATIVNIIQDVAAQMAAGIHGAIALTGIRRIYVGGGIHLLGDGFLEMLRRAVANESPLKREVQLDYGEADEIDVGYGIASYLVDHEFDVTSRR